MNASRLLPLAALMAACSVTLAGQQGSRIGPSGGEVAGVAVGVGALVGVGVALAINHSHHVISGCVVAGPHGLELEAGDSRTYALEGDAGNLGVGDRVKVHGSKVRKARGAPGPDVFRVDKVTKDYGACHGNGATAPGAAQ